MKFSIIIPVYNVEKYIRRMIESILNQNYDNYEIILVDDGSTDNSADICDTIVKENIGKVKLIRQANTGPLLARRRGVEEATGDYLLLLDSDDTISSLTLIKLSKIISQNMCDLVLFDCCLIESGVPTVQKLGYVEDENVCLDQVHKDVMTLKLASLCCKCIKKDLFDVSSCYDEYGKITMMEDLLQSLPIIDKAKSVRYIGEPLYNYHKRTSGSITSSSRVNAFSEHKKLFKIMQGYGEKWNISQEEYTSVWIASFHGDLTRVLKSKISIDDKKKCVREILSDEYYIELKKRYKDTYTRSRTKVAIWFLNVVNRFIWR